MDGLRTLLTLSALAAVAAACGGAPAGPTAPTPTAVIRIDGSSTVYPITEAVAEEFAAARPDVRVTVGVSGTGGGFKKFVAGEIEISDASRPIKASEGAAAEAAGIGYVEIPVAFDGLSVVVHPENDWVDHLTLEELKRIWEPGSTVRTWRDVRPTWPDRPIALYGPGTASGTFDYFTEEICGTSGASRADYTASEDDHVLVQGVAGDRDSLGYFGYAYYAENASRLRAVPIDGGSGPVAPSPETIEGGTYTPLSRPIFIYVRADALERPEVRAFVGFYLEQAARLAREVGYVSLPADVYAAVRRRVESRTTGTAWAEGSSGDLRARYGAGT